MEIKLHEKDIGGDRITNDSDTAMSILGVPGRLTHRTVKIGRPADMWFKQRWVSERRSISGYGSGGYMKVEVRFDDELNNQHNSFAITADVVTNESARRGDIAAGGCLHEEIVRVFPELAPLVKFHLFDDRGPWSCISNTTYLAGDADCWGRRKGEPCSWEEVFKFGEFPIGYKIPSKEFKKWLLEALEFNATTPKGNHNRPSFAIVAVPYKDNKPGGYQFGPKFTLEGFPCEWYQCPFDSEQEALEFLEAVSRHGVWVDRTVTGYSEGKERELDAARSVACWPEATDEELSVSKEELTKVLEARLPGLIEGFKATIKDCGFYWTPEEFWNRGQTSLTGE